MLFSKSIKVKQFEVQGMSIFINEKEKVSYMLHRTMSFETKYKKVIFYGAKKFILKFKTDKERKDFIKVIAPNLDVLT